jgi:nucleotide-binding universal stress UspA family protein
MPFAFKKILCPIDFDDNSIAALDAAAEIARESGATLEVLHVVPIVIQPGSMPIYVDVYSVEEQTAKTQLLELAKTHLQGVKCELRTTVAQPSAAILHAQRQLGADAIVMATHGRRGFAHFFLGSVAERVVREADCPVLTIRGHHTAAASAHAQA